LSTEDGSLGHRGRITELLPKNKTGWEDSVVWSCGPMGLLEAVQAWAQGQGLKCELSVEEAMGCGTGVCLGCVVRNREGHYVRACREGPVFSGDDLEF
jgi:dihydroorotate dehydrogenase electron transfer subunit